MKSVCGVVTQRRAWVTSYKVEVYDGSSWWDVNNGQSFTANTDDMSTSVLDRSQPCPNARFVRVVVNTEHHHVTMRAAVLIEANVAIVQLSSATSMV